MLTQHLISPIIVQESVALINMHISTKLWSLPTGLQSTVPAKVHIQRYYNTAKNELKSKYDQGFEQVTALPILFSSFKGKYWHKLKDASKKASPPMNVDKPYKCS